MEAAGAVFLPASGMRKGNLIYHVMGSCDYWTSTCYQGSSSQYSSYGFYFGYETVIANNITERYNGHSVRLVKPLE